MISKIDYRALAEFRYAVRRFLVFSEGAARAAGLEPRQHQLLLAVKGLPSGQRPTIRVLAERLQLRHHSVVELIDRSVDQGLVARRRGDDDRREILVQITPRGERLLRQLSVAHRSELETVGPLLARAIQAVIIEPRATRRASPRPSGVARHALPRSRRTV